jgi:hypothetical protein
MCFRMSNEIEHCLMFHMDASHKSETIQNKNETNNDDNIYCAKNEQQMKGFLFSHG